MSTYISNRELEELGEGLSRHYLENAHVQMAAQVGVSFSAMQIRLRELDLLEYHPLDEYVEKNLLECRARTASAGSSRTAHGNGYAGLRKPAL